ncbi:MAG TPA: helix-turn-helix transcriptional regulator [Candidatus Limnocylindria bacterium]
MDDQRLAAAIRSLRHARGWRQVDIARRAGVSRTSVWLVERGQSERLTIRTVRRVASASGLFLGWDTGPAPQLGRARDADHATLAEATARQLAEAGWEVRPEVSFSRYGERGRVDLLAYHPDVRILLVIEVKTLIVDVQQLLGGLDVKARLAPSVAREWGWAARAVVPALVVAEGTTNRRRLSEHPILFARFALRGWSATIWIRSPVTGVSGLLLLAKLPVANHGDLRRAGRQRVRRTRSWLST